METSYYYFVATLPALYFGEKPPMTLAEFLSDAESLMHTRDFVRLEQALSTEAVSSGNAKGVFKQWLDFNHQFRNEMAWARSQALKKDPLEHLRGERYPEPRMVEAIAQAQKAKNPLEAERILDRFRWDFLDEVVCQHYFNFAVILTYGLKLQILERYQEIESDKGLKRFEHYKEFKAVKEIIGIG